MLCSCFSFHSILYNIQVRQKQAVNINFSRTYSEMINPANVVKVFADRASNLLYSSLSNTSTTSVIINRECEVAELLCGVLQSITNRRSHFFEVEIALDHEPVEDNLINDVECENEDGGALDPNWNGDEEDEDEKALCQGGKSGFLYFRSTKAQRSTKKYREVQEVPRSTA